MKTVIGIFLGLALFVSPFAASNQALAHGKDGKACECSEYKDCGGECADGKCALKGKKKSAKKKKAKAPKAAAESTANEAVQPMEDAPKAE